MGKEDMETASIIVPVYNKEEYLDKCLQSLLHQTYKDLDIVLVNDGSTDNSLDICRQYAVEDSRIQVIDQENQGVSGARNTGLAHARGEYIFWVDPDDFIKTDLVEKVIPKFHAGADVVLFGFAFLHGENFHGKMVWDTSLPSAQLKIISSCVTGWELCCKAYRRQLWEGVRFPVHMHSSEDVYVSGQIMKKAKCILALPGMDYFVQREHHGSLTQVHLAKSYVDTYTAWTYNQTAALSPLFEHVCEQRILMAVSKALLKNRKDHSLSIEKQEEFQNYYNTHTDLPLDSAAPPYFDYQKEVYVAEITGKVKQRTMKKAMKLYAVDSVRPVLSQKNREQLRMFIISHPHVEMRKEYQYLQKAITHNWSWVYHIMGFVLKMR